VRPVAVLSALALVAAACAYRPAVTPTTDARPDGEGAIVAAAGVFDSGGKAIGSARFSDTRNGVRIEGEFAGLPKGAHGIHIHAVGRCDPPDFASAGGHFNPDGKKHGHLAADGPHAGDLPNLVLGDDGKGTLLVNNVYLSLAPGASNSLLKTGGTSLVIHADPDDDKTDPAGNSGARLACGVIARSGP
jgi:Cu-Zn family superoxide dismutase